MERMKQNIKYVSIGMYKQLEEENKKLKEKLKYYKEKSEFFSKVIVKYQEENEDLKQIIKLFKNYEGGKNKLEGMSPWTRV